MNYTNSYALPEPMLRAIQADVHEVPAGYISVTELIRAPRQYQLIKRHDDEIQLELMDQIYRLLGSAFHQMMDRHSVDFHEEILSAKFNGLNICGRPDLYTNGTIIDYKICKSASYRYEKPEWEEQLNLYRWLLKENGKTAMDLEICAIYRDWNEYASQKSGPSFPAMRLPVRIWLSDDLHEYLDERTTAHASAALLSDEDLPECTPEERWHKGAKWAVYHKASYKRASKLFDNEDEAKAYLSEFPNGRIEYRAGESTRCERYCSAAPFCNQWQQIQKEELEKSMSEAVKG